MKKINITDLLIFIISAELAGALSSLVSGDFTGRYAMLEKPPLSPPGAVFPVVWFILYALMGISAYIIYESDASFEDKKSALTIYGVQLAVNALWSVVFFRFGLPWAAAAVIILLIILVAVMIIRFGRISRTAAYMNIPYLLWLIFAAYLNIGFALLN